MKKSLSILLSLILVVSSFWGALTLSANAMEVDYNDSSSWQLYSTNWISKPTVNGAGNKVGENGIAEVTDADVTLPDALEDGKGITINQTGTYAATKLESLIVGRAYNFSFKFMLPTTVGTTSGRTMFAVYLAKEGATVNGNGVVSDTYNANASITIDEIAASSGNAYNDGLWHNVSIIFTATDEMVTSGIYVGASYGGTHFGDGLFFDDFDFSRIDETTVDYNANSKWNLYATNWISKPTVNGAGNKVGENGIAEVTASDVDTLPDAMGDGKGIKINQTGTYAATKLESLIVGRAYNFSFKFMLPNTVASQGGRTIFAVYLAKEGATVNGNGVVSDIYNSEATITIDDAVASSGNTYNDGAWHTVNIAFTATQEMVTNGVYVGAAYGGTHFGAGLFFDDFDLTKVDETTVDYNSNVKWNLYATNWITKPTVNGAGNKVGENGIAEVTATDIATLPDAMGDGKGIQINQTGTYAAAKLEGLVENTVYNFSFKFMIPDTVVSQGGRTIFAVYLAKHGATVDANGVVSETYNSNAIITIDNASVSSGNGYNDGAWHTANIEFTATADMVTNGVYVGAAYGGTHFGDGLFFDDFDLEKISATAIDYNNKANWQQYSNHTSFGFVPDIDGDGNDIGANWAASEVTETGITGVGLSDAMGDGKAFKVGGIATVLGARLQNLTVGDTYKFTFNYLIPAGISGYSSYTLFEVYLAKHGAVVDAATHTLDAAKETYNSVATITVDGKDSNIDDADRAANAENAWKTVSIEFTATQGMVDNGVYVGISAGSWTGMMYADDFKLEKVGEDEGSVGYNDSAKWQLYSTSWIEKPTVNGAGNKVGENGIAEVTAVDVTTLPDTMGDGKGIRIYQTGTYAATKLEGLTVGKHYKFTFQFMIPDTVATTSGRTMFNVYLAKHGATVGSNGAVNDTYNGEAVIKIGDEEVSGGNAYNDGVWRTATVHFTATAGMVANGVYVGASYGGTHFGDGLYFDDFDLKEVAEAPAIATGYNISTKWKLYSTNWITNKGTVDGVNGDNAGTTWLPVVTSSTPALPNAMGDGKAIALQGTGMYAATKLEDLVAGKHYKFTFEFMIPDTIATTSRPLFNVFLAKHGATVNSSGVVSDTYNNNAIIKIGTQKTSGGNTYNDSTWRTVTVHFTATDSMVNNGVYVGASYGGTHGTLGLYLDDFDLQEVTDAPELVSGYNSSSKWQLYSTIWIDKPTVNGAGNKVGENGIAEVTAADVPTLPDTMGDGIGIRINQTGTYAATNLDELVAGKNYKFTFKFMVPDTVTSASGRTIFAIYLAKHGATVATNGVVSNNYNSKALIKIGDEKVSGGNNYNDGAWHTASVHFTATQEMIDGGVYVGASYGGTHFGAGLYFDDFDLQEVADAPKIATGYNDSSLWQLYATNWINKPIVNGAGYSVGENGIKEVTSSDIALPDAMDDAQGIRIYQTGTYVAAKLNDIEAGKHYKFSFKFMLPTTVNTTSGREMFAVYLAKHGATVAANGALDNTYNSKAVITIENAAKKYNDGVWRTVTLHFTATDEMVTDGAYVGASYGGTHFGDGLYLDDFDMKEVAEGPAIPEGYNSADNWEIYEGSSATDKCPDVIDGTGVNTPAGTSASVTNNYDKNYTNGSAGSSLLINWHLHLYATKLVADTEGNPLTADQVYTLTFNYFVPEGSVWGESAKSWADTGVFKEGTTVAKNGVADAYHKKGSTLVGDTGKWNTFKMLFVAGEEPLYFGIKPTFKSGLKIYIDDFKVTKGDTRVFDTPENKYIINFEENKQYIDSGYTDRYQIKNGSLYYKPGTYTSSSVLNQVPVKADEHPVYTLPVIPERVYKISYRVKIDPSDIANGVPDTDKAGMEVYSMGEMVSGGNVSKGTPVGEWKTYTTHFSTGKYDRCLSFTFNLGTTSSGVWFDDIVVELTDKKVFAGHGKEPIEEFEINFDDFNVNVTSPYTVVEKAPERNGVSSNALHILPVDEQVTFNANNHYAGIDDPLLTIPCEPETVYKFSFWRYNEGKAPSYFAFYYNFDLNALSKNLFYLHKQKAYSKQWVKHELIFTTDPGQTSFDIWINAGTNVVETWIDDISIEKLKTGVDEMTDLTYCEKLYDLTDNLSNYQDFAAGKAGVYKMKLDKDRFYTVAATFSGKAKMVLSFDGVNPMEETGRGGKPIIDVNSSGERFGVSIYSGKQEYLYIIIKDTQNFKMENVKIFNSVSINGARRTMGYAEDPNVPPLTYDEIEDIKTK